LAILILIFRKFESLVFRDVKYTYPERETPTIHIHNDLVFNQKTTYGIIGIHWKRRKYKLRLKVKKLHLILQVEKK
jgi:hypothetical protein